MGLSNYPYIAIARPDNWTKNLLMLAGVGVAMMLAGHASVDISALCLGFLALCIAASANYVLNEYLDAGYDRYHPIKNCRPGARSLLRKRWVVAEYIFLLSAGIILAGWVNPQFLATIVIFLAGGVAYNLPPLRCKDKAYLDVLLEGGNSPLRLLLGWLVIVPHSLPPSSFLLMAWSIGAFMMTVKRYAEYQLFDNKGVAGSYRKSYAVYSADSLLIMAFFFGQLSAFFIATFLLKYHTELIVAFPLFCLWFSWYMLLGIRRNTAIQRPEKLYREYGFVLFSLMLLIVLLLLSEIRIPFLDPLALPLHY